MLELGSYKRLIVSIRNMSSLVEKKVLSNLESSYNPKTVEDGWYEWWEKNELFTPSEEPVPGKAKWIALLPPPNVTGSLHIGHALTVSIQDCLARWHRMKGDITLWIPGTDHAGIATQTVVERMLYQKYGLKRQDYGRDKFTRKTLEWNDKYGSNIKNQLRRMGASLDWTREAFTMDKERSNAVIEAFVRLYDSGLIYRKTRLVSWCPYLSTAISDVEVDQFEVTSPTHIKIPGYDSSVEVGFLWYFKYKVFSSERFVSVATTRIETMLGDVAVAVHPNDDRYKDLVGCKLLHPFFPDRDLVVIADEHVDPEFGTGAVKITPSHDKNDYEIAERHSLPFINIYTDDGKINENGGEFANMHRFECRKNIEQKLRELELFEDKKPNTKPMFVPRCSRTGDILEYMLVPQWYVNCKELAYKAIESVRSGNLKLIPSSYVSVWYQWLENIQDWCVSRQLWWGHRIPAYKIISTEVCDYGDKWIIARNIDEAHERFKNSYPHCSEYTLQQDDDVLDTWFSSGLFPLSTLGWPDESHKDFINFFPTTLLETGNDIIFFWVARMVMLSLHFVDKLPFSQVYMHPLVRDARGEKMSKSKGNVVDPIDIIDGATLEKLNSDILNSSLPQSEIKKALALQKQQFPDGIPSCGVDALRLGLLSLTRQNRAILLDVNKLVCSRHFGNKIWNATKFAILRTRFCEYDGVVPSEMKWEDKWILHKLNQYIIKMNKSFMCYQFGDAVQASYDFWLYQLCDVYLELVKPRLPSLVNSSDLNRYADLACVYTIFKCFTVALKLLHPIMPYITEELYHHLPPIIRDSESISMSQYPNEMKEWNCDTLDNEFDLVISSVHVLRSLSATLGLLPGVHKYGYLTTNRRDYKDILMHKTSLIANLSKFEQVDLVDEDTNELSDCVQNIINSDLVAYIKVDDSVDLIKTTSMLNDRLTKNNKSLESYNKK